MWKNWENCRWLIASLVTVLLPLTHGQAHHFVIGHHQRNFDQVHREPNTRVNYTNTTLSDFENSNSTIIATTVENPNDMSEAVMDIIRIVWYVATVLTFLGFLVLMTCSHRRCNGTQRRSPSSTTGEEPIPPPTPSPSYSQFAPPSYESIATMQHTGVFLVPFPIDQNSEKDGNTSLNNNSITNTTPINFYTINELQKLSR